AALTLLKEIPVGKGAYNVEPAPDGKLVLVTNKKKQSVSLVDAVGLTEIARIATSKKIVHGVASSPDGRLASRRPRGRSSCWWQSGRSPSGRRHPPGSRSAP